MKVRHIICVIVDACQGFTGSAVTTSYLGANTYLYCVMTMSTKEDIMLTVYVCLIVCLYQINSHSYVQTLKRLLGNIDNALRSR